MRQLKAITRYSVVFLVGICSACPLASQWAYTLYGAPDTFLSPSKERTVIMIARVGDNERKAGQDVLSLEVLLSSRGEKGATTFLLPKLARTDTPVRLLEKEEIVFVIGNLVWDKEQLFPMVIGLPNQIWPQDGAFVLAGKVYPSNEGLLAEPTLELDRKLLYVAEHLKLADAVTAKNILEYLTYEFSRPDKDQLGLLMEVRKSIRAIETPTDADLQRALFFAHTFGQLRPEDQVKYKASNIQDRAQLGIEISSKVDQIVDSSDSLDSFWANSGWEDISVAIQRFEPWEYVPAYSLDLVMGHLYTRYRITANGYRASNAGIRSMLEDMLSWDVALASACVFASRLSEDENVRSLAMRPKEFGYETKDAEWRQEVKETLLRSINAP